MTKDSGPQAAKLKMARQFIEAIPHAHTLGMTLADIGEGSATLTMPYDLRLVGDPRTGVIHGGAVSALLDTCCGAAVMSHPGAPAGTATIDLRVEYMRAAKPGQMITARAECYHITRNVAFVRASAHDEEEGLPVAAATGTFTVERPKKGGAA
ncbi:PaaI family thioesterase [Thioclava sp. A2]|uniref:PaaI family thioesterase n=1 Tax=Thioclava sp. FCG-A2 TaxID=3080562 RepID=UPI002954469E|nr:PaaI family thioesterase [Thioclava sp. A2]MDV7271776.1 PaaI family thioesterase [Thioclava sp. A2]